MLRTVLLSIIFCITGLALAVGCLFLLAVSSLRFDHPILGVLGIRKPQIVGFLPYWLLAKADKNYAPYITTLTYFGLVVDRDGSLLKLVKPNEEEPGWTNLKGDKYISRLAEGKKNNVKQSLLVVSGDDDVIRTLLTDPEASAKKLVFEALPIMKDKGFTDLNLDIETFMEGSASSQLQFTRFVQTVKNELVTQRLGTLTIDLIPIALVKPKLYDAKALGAIADSIVLMTYDYHYLGSFTAGAIAPVGGAGETIEFDVETAVKEALKAIPKNKILLGIPLYGYEWETINKAPEAATIPGGGSTASTRRIADILAGCATCSAQMDPVAKEPYLIYEENDYFNQIYYENEDSMKEKILLAKKYELGGVALWALGYEDTTMLRPLEEYKKSYTLPFTY